MENKTFTKKEVFNFLKEKYNPDETTIELADLWNFFGITEKDILNDTLKDINHANSEEYNVDFCGDGK